MLTNEDLLRRIRDWVRQAIPYAKESHRLKKIKNRKNVYNIERFREAQPHSDRVMLTLIGLIKKDIDRLETQILQENEEQSNP